ncbi:methylamine utilization protein MauJ [Salidesulfovibrio brasiliensis]|uniref:methylamine utilization protein MauJ n=1 Tax=Salidesulfovibrio brasiliensis TaxID=221711 RepID=UPI000AE93585|nr:methylamine utilization protein MauJ [Salidesulfovibrio brasiliensis]
MYAVIAFDTSAIFNKDKYYLKYGSYEVEIVKECVVDVCESDNKRNISNQIIIECSKSGQNHAHESGLRLLSELSWFYGISIYSTFHTGGSIPVKGLTRFVGHCGGWRTPVDISSFVPIETGREQRDAMSLYREGISSNSDLYMLLCLYKILEINMKRDERRDLIIGYIREKRLSNKSFGLGNEKMSPDDVERFVYSNGRCGVAHANMDSRLIIDKFKDLQQARFCNSILQPVVEKYMSEDMKLPRF